MKVHELREHAEEIGFTPQEQTRWLAPSQLARTAVKVVLALVFAGYADKREIQGALPSRLLHAPLRRSGAHESEARESEAQELWFDFVADLGDGFDATSSVAWALAAEKLTVEAPGQAPPGLSRGSLLVLGGDEVYPVASARGYEDKMSGPYRAALPSADDQPLLVALPGNHDWYDGLTAFLRIFAQQRPIGGWQTRQTRSYFVVQLPQRWWLVGLDSQLGEYFDDPQLRYFASHLSANLEPGDGVIVCSAEPTWVKSADKDADAFDALHWFDRNYVRTRVDPQTGERSPTHASIRLWLTGDRHHYTRYAERLPEDPAGSDGGLPPDPRRRQMVTCGLGGAYLAATHRLPAALPLPPGGSRLRERDEPPVVFERAGTTHPTPAESRRIVRGLAEPWCPGWLPRRNPGFAELTGGLHAVLFLLLSFLFALSQGVLRPVDAVRDAGAGDVGGFVGGFCAAVVALLALRWAYRLARPRVRATPSTALVAVLLQVAVALAVLAVAVAVPFPDSWSGWTVLVACLVLAGLVGALLGSEAFALWVLSARSGAAVEWQMSGQSIEDHKGFLRLHLAPDGDLTLYPLVLDGICRDWELRDDLALGKRPVPAQPPAVRLLEDPVVITRNGSPP
ncbi:hypothetical protein F7Q99_33800 [Streptomyces kaniharaensis]|uniref:Metallophosphoesterase n=1 Tax=Streptomyces kaniharaensis TaxID=212423 RepID=A0A6N7L529_9ACTN|nr:hypothetical protein [Streptomyces kaniharaensis]MQS17033.1 hypothetical protein [Streptomyces kaniharaensis]